jgi:hypothetical protein
LTVTPSAGRRAREVLERREQPGRFAFESCKPSSGSRAALEDTASTRPHPRSRIPGRTRRRMSIGLTTSVRWAASHCSTAKPSGSSPGGGPPVFAT